MAKPSQFSIGDRAYGLWSLKTGEEILFDRGYMPIGVRSPGCRGRLISGWEDYRGRIISEQWLTPPPGHMLAYTRKAAKECKQWHDDVVSHFMAGRKMTPLLKLYSVKLHAYVGTFYHYLDSKGMRYGGPLTKNSPMRPVT